MNKEFSLLCIVTIALAIASAAAKADRPTNPPNDTSIPKRVVRLESNVAALLKNAEAQQALINDLIKENLELRNRVACVAAVSGTNDFIFDGCNVHIRNGAGSTDSVNGYGNLVVGYNAARAKDSDKTGSHNFVVGDNHNYSSHGGLVAGFQNTVSGAWASVSGGAENTASAPYASVSAGQSNLATHSYASVTGGWANFASDLHASVSGGVANRAFGPSSSISGGENNEARTLSSSILGSAGKVTMVQGETIPPTP
jgi:hypothetical protein